MIAEKIKIRVSEFVYMILHRDAETFGFMKKDANPNFNAFLNRLIPILLQFRKNRREEIHYVLEEENRRTDAEEIYACVNEVIDRVYFSDAELDRLQEEIWIRPNKYSLPVFDEIADVETALTHTDTSVFIRGLLNEYARFPQYKREKFAFYEEVDSFLTGCQTGQIYHFRHNGKTKTFFPHSCMYGFASDQTNYLIGFDIAEKIIRAIPVHEVRHGYLEKQRYKPSEKLIDLLLAFVKDFDFKKEVSVPDE